MHELKLYEVQKKYKDKTAVKQVSYTFKHGVYGLLGENGAGKTTLMRLICGVLQPTTGNIYYDGMEIAQMGAEYRRLLGYLPQELGYYDNFTAERFLRYIAALKAMSAECSEQKIQELLELVELQKDKKKKLRTFSGGMLRRVGIAQALLNNPEILVLDEPTAGLDPKGRDEILDQIAELHKVRGITIILVSHSMEDVAKYVERLIVVNHGKIAFDDIPKKVFAHYKELEEMGLAAPQITYIMHALKEKGLPVDPADTTVEEAKQDILHALREMNSSLLKGGVQND